MRRRTDFAAFELSKTAMEFRLVCPYKPQGDQVTAIQALTRGIYDGDKHQVLLGVTGSGKTFSMAKVIETVNLSLIHI